MLIYAFQKKFCGIAGNGADNILLLFVTSEYQFKGRVEIRYGQGFKQYQVCETGDFIFTPPSVPHQPRNLSATEHLYVLAARDDPD